MDAPTAFEKWWQALPLRDGKITADHVRQAWDAGVMFERQSCAFIAANAAEFANADRDSHRDGFAAQYCSDIASAIKART